MNDLAVAFALSRHGEGVGGDSIQMQKTMEVLEKQGVSVFKIDSPDELRRSNVINILHVFNLPYSERTLSFIEAGQEQDTCVVLSPIYWDFSHSQVVDFVESHFGLSPTPTLKQLVPLIFRLYLLGRRAVHPNALFSIRPGRLRKAVRMADCLLPNSRAELCYLANWIDLDFTELRAKSHVVYNAVDTELFHPTDEAKSTIEGEYGIRDFLLQVGVVDQNKNQLTLLEAASGLDISVVFIGRNKNPYGRKLADAAKGREDVLVLDSVPQKDLPTFYSAAKVHALPSFRESPGLVSLEAALCGCEIVVSNEDHCPVREYFGEYAHVCNPYSVASVRNAIREAYSVKRNNEKFRTQIRDRFSWNVTASDTLAAYRSLEL